MSQIKLKNDIINDHHPIILENSKEEEQKTTEICQEQPQLDPIT